LAQQFGFNIANLAAEPRELEFATGLKENDGDRLISLLSDDHSNRLPNGKHRVCLEAHGYRWFRVGGLDYLLKRREF
jgi:maltose alpha-D-glucosyltransferase/alpha-amylase